MNYMKTIEEFKKFVSAEDDILFKTLYETLYYFVEVNLEV